MEKKPRRNAEWIPKNPQTAFRTRFSEEAFQIASILSRISLKCKKKTRDLEEVLEESEKPQKKEFFFAAFMSLELGDHCNADCIHFFLFMLVSEVSLSLLQLCAAVVAATLPGVVFAPSVHTRLRCLLCCCFNSLGDFLSRCSDWTVYRAQRNQTSYYSATHQTGTTIADHQVTNAV